MKLKERSTGKIIEGQIINDDRNGLEVVYYEEREGWWKVCRLNGTGKSIFIPVKDNADIVDSSYGHEKY